MKYVLILTVFFQSLYALSIEVIDVDSLPVPSAVLSLVSSGATELTGTDGSYDGEFESTTSIAQFAETSLDFEGNILNISNANGQKFNWRISNSLGQITLAKNGLITQSEYQIDFNQINLAEGAYFVQLRLPGAALNFQLIQRSDQLIKTNNVLARVSPPPIDTIEISKSGYITRSIPISDLSEDLGSIVLYDTSIIPLDSFYRVNILDTDTILPKEVSVLFSAKDEEGKGITGLRNCYPDLCDLTVNGSPVTSESAISITKPDIFKDSIYTVMLLDNSSSLGTEGLDSLKSAAIDFIRSKSANQYIAIYSFSSIVYLEQEFSGDSTQLIQAIEGIGLGPSTTNLYGAFITGLGRLRTQTSVADSLLIRSNLVAFTDGRDTQGSATLSQVLALSDGQEVYAVGSGGEVQLDTLNLITQNRAYLANDLSDIKGAFETMRSDVDKEINSVYYLHYDSPKRGDNEHELILFIRGNSNLGEDAQDTTHFNSIQFADGFPAEAQNVTLTIVDDSILVAYEYFDIESDTEGEPRVRWYLNGIYRPEYDSLFSIPVTATSPRTEYRVVLTPRQRYVTPLLGISGRDTIEYDDFPEVDSLRIEGVGSVDSVLTAIYQFSDPDGDLEGSSLFQWYRDSVAINGANANTYTITSADSGSSIYFEVIPVSQTGLNIQGSPLTSEFIRVYDFITDSRDGEIYRTSTINGLTWFAQELRYLPEVNSALRSSDSTPYYYVYGYNPTGATESEEIANAKLTENYQKHGVYYNWPASMNGDTITSTETTVVQGACPVGWHLPSYEEFNSLAEYVARDIGVIDNSANQWFNVGQALKATTGWTNQWGTPENTGTDLYGFSAIGNGLVTSANRFQDIGEITYYYTSSKQGSMPRHWTLDADRDSFVYGNTQFPKFAYSIRCVQNSPIVYNIEVTGAPLVDSVLTVDFDYIHPDNISQGSEARYQWFRNDSIIVGATQASYTMTSVDVGQLLSVSVSVNDLNGQWGLERRGNFDAIQTLIDSRDNESYTYRQLGEQTWMLQNLRYLPQVDSVENGSEDAATSDSPSYYVYDYIPTGATEAEQVIQARASANYSTHGVLYNGFAALETDLCPTGWKVPSASDYEALAAFIDSRFDNAGKPGSYWSIAQYVRSTEGWTGSSTPDEDPVAFNLLPSGVRGLTNGFDKLNTSVSMRTSELDYLVYSVTSSTSVRFSGAVSSPDAGYPLRCIQE